MFPERRELLGGGDEVGARKTGWRVRVGGRAPTLQTSRNVRGERDGGFALAVSPACP